jgi:hypothetical protein
MLLVGKPINYGMKVYQVNIIISLNKDILTFVNPLVVF